jgi:hypothetical protein
VGEYTKFVELDDDYFGPIDGDNTSINQPTAVTLGSKMNSNPGFNMDIKDNDLLRNSSFSEEVPF